MESLPTWNSNLLLVQLFAEHEKLENPKALERLEMPFNHTNVCIQVTQHPGRSLWKEQKDMTNPLSSKCDSLRQRLPMFWCRLRVSLQLEDSERTKRIEYVQWCCQRIQKISDFQRKIFDLTTVTLKFTEKLAWTLSAARKHKVLVKDGKLVEIAKKSLCVNQCMWIEYIVHTTLAVTRSPEKVIYNFSSFIFFLCCPGYSQI